MKQKQNFPYGCINELGVFPAALNGTSSLKNLKFFT